MKKKIKCIVHRDKGIPGQKKKKHKCTLDYLTSYLSECYLQRTRQLKVPAAKTNDLSLVSGCMGVPTHTLLCYHHIISPSYLYKPKSGKDTALPVHFNTL